MKLSLVFGTRPQIIKCVSVIRECVKKKIDITIINTGQHYDFELSQIFLKEFNLPNPQYNLGVGSGSHGWQTGNIMIRTERALQETSPSVCIIPGDTNSALASALAAVKLKIPVAHLEAGLRNFEEFMPEEVNRRAIDHFAQLLFAPSSTAECNLLNEGLSAEKVVHSGDTMYDLFLQEQDKIRDTKMPDFAKVFDRYIVLTVHREENTENPEILMEIGSAIKMSKIPTLFPIHPRTKKRFEKFGLLDTFKKIENLTIVDPLGYHTVMKLIQKSWLVMTDSGGMQKEVFMSKVPCITLRRNTEWIETVRIGANRLVQDIKSETILNTINEVSANRDVIIDKMKKAANPYGEGKAAEKIVTEILDRF